MEEGPKARRVIVLLVAAEAAAVAVLHRLGGVEGFAIPRHDLGRWLQQTPSEDVLLAGVRLAALVAAWWLLGSTVLYIAARATRLHGTARALGWATLPAVRRWVDRVATVSIVALTALGAARPGAADPPPVTTAPAPVVVDADHRDRSTLPDLPPVTARTGRTVESPATTTETAAAPPITTVAPATPTAPVVPVVPAAPASPPSAPTAGLSHTVTRGEHLWSIASAHLAATSGRAAWDLTAGDIAPYWLRVVELNRPRLQSGDPNLVYAGEVVELPPV